MVAVTGLETHLEVDGDGLDPPSLSVSARHEAVLADGSRVLLLDDRGWSQSGPMDIWERTSAEEIADTGRTVVGADEPFDGRSQEDMQVSHWAHLASVLSGRGVEVDPSELRWLPHEVVLSEELLARIGPQRGVESP